MTKKKPHSYADQFGVYWIPADTDIPMEFKIIGNSLDNLRSLIGGGWIEIVRTKFMPRFDCGCHTALVIDEDGLMKRLPQNPRASILYPHGDGIVGDAFLIGEGYVMDSNGDPDMDFISLPPEFKSWEGPGSPVPAPAKIG
jgi:hypothetical protein